MRGYTLIRLQLPEKSTLHWILDSVFLRLAADA
jgi:hypothetical protein